MVLCLTVGLINSCHAVLELSFSYLSCDILYTMLNGEVSKGRQLANFRVSVLGTKRKQFSGHF